MRKNSHYVIPKGGVCPRNLLFLGTREEKQIPRFARDDKQYFFRSLFSLRVFCDCAKTRRLKPTPRKARRASQRGIFAAVLVDSKGGAAPPSQGLLINRMAEANRFEIVKPSPDRILIVEDEENARQGYEALLRQWGYDVLGVGSAEDALAKFSEFAPAVLIADVELPGMNGLDLLARLGEELQHVPAIVITGKGSEERAVRPSRPARSGTSKSR